MQNYDIRYLPFPDNIAVVLSYKPDSPLVIYLNNTLPIDILSQSKALALSRYMGLEHWVKLSPLRLYVKTDKQIRVELVNPLREKADRLWTTKPDKPFKILG